MVTSMRSIKPLALLVALVATLGLVACDDADARMTTVVIDVDLTSADRNLQKVGPNEQSVYGWNHLVGTGTADGEPVEVEMLGEVDYTNGGGDFAGFITFTFADGSKVGVAMVDGKATAKSDTSNARFSALLRVIGGTGNEVSTTGRGTFTGERMDTLGGVVQSHFVLRLRR